MVSEGTEAEALCTVSVLQGVAGARIQRGEYLVRSTREQVGVLVGRESRPTTWRREERHFALDEIR